VRRHLGIRSIDLRFIEAGSDDGNLGVVGNDEARCPANSSKGARVGADPIAERLRPGGLHVSEVKFDAPMTATKICAWRTSPVSRSTITGTVSPAQSTNSLSPPRRVWRIVTESLASQLR
jgi:hypothetical protein